MTAKKTAAIRTGRPSLYTPELAERICSLIEEGYSERKISKMDGMPDIVTIWRWKEKYPEFCKQSARAREISADRYNDERLAEIDWLKSQVRESAQSGMSIPKGVVEGSRAIMQELAREASYRDDRRYGDRKKVTLDATENVGEGLAAFYDGLLNDLKERQKKDG